MLKRLRARWQGGLLPPTLLDCTYLRYSSRQFETLSRLLGAHNATRVILTPQILRAEGKTRNVRVSEIAALHVIDLIRLLMRALCRVGIVATVMVCGLYLLEALNNYIRKADIFGWIIGEAQNYLAL